MQEHGEHHEVRSPSMHISYQESKCHGGLQIGNVIPLQLLWPVEEHQEDARHGEKDKEEETQAAKAQRVTDLDGMALHLHWVKVI